MTAQPVSIKIIASGTFPTAWYQTQPPNGCLPSHTERRVLHVEVYEADYYGIPKLYARGYATLERPDYPFSDQRFGHWDDGHPTRVNQWLESIQTASLNESMSDNASNSQ
jgi:hypothetical protein